MTSEAALTDEMKYRLLLQIAHKVRNTLDVDEILHPTLARAVAAINNFLIGLSNKLGYSNLASARRLFNGKIADQLHV